MASIKRSAAALLLSSLVIFGVSGQKSEPLFSVNKKPVLTDEFIYLYRKNHQNKQEDFTESKFEEYLLLFINYKLKVEEALSRGMDTTTAFKKEYNGYREELLKPHLPDSKVVDSLVKITYDRLKEEVKVSHILIAVNPDAKPGDTLSAYKKIFDLRRRVLAGEDFNSLAAQYSEEPGAETTKGSLGYFTAMQMVFPFEQAAYTTPVGEVSHPVRTRFGYHILKVHDRQPSRGEVEVSHIMLRTGDGADNEQAKNLIFDIFDQLQKGVTWEELCKQYSEDPNSKDHGGRLRPFGVGAMGSAPGFEEMAFSLDKKGSISDPFQTPFGWHILRLESKIPVPPFEELKASLTNRVSRDERVQISRQALRTRMKTEMGYSENENAKARLLLIADSSLMKGQWKPLLPVTTEKEVLFTMQNQTFLVKDFLKYVADHQTAHDGSPQQYLLQLLANYADAVQLQLLEEKIKKESPDYKWLLKEYYEGILLFEIMEKEIWNKATEDSTGQRKYYDGHKESYNAGNRIAGRIYTSPSKEILTELQGLLTSGDSSLQEFIKRNKIRADEGPFERDDRPVLSRIAWTPGFQRAENNNLNYLILIEKILPPGPKSFQEARSSVISDYQTHLEKSWIAGLRKKFKVDISKKVKKRTFDELLK